MRAISLLFGLVFILFACQDPKVDTQEMNNSAELNKSSSAIDEQIRLHGIEILNAYYHLSPSDVMEKISSEFGFTQKGDLQYMLNYEKNIRKEAEIKNRLEEYLNELTDEERKKLEQKAVRWLRMSQIVNGSLCKSDGETYYEDVYEVPELRAIIDTYIDPSFGQSVHSLASGQMDEIDVDIWNYLVDIDHQKSLGVISEFLKKCMEPNE